MATRPLSSTCCKPLPKYTPRSDTPHPFAAYAIPSPQTAVTAHGANQLKTGNSPCGRLCTPFIAGEQWAGWGFQGILPHYHGCSRYVHGQRRGGWRKAAGFAQRRVLRHASSPGRWREIRGKRYEDGETNPFPRREPGPREAPLVPPKVCAVRSPRRRGSGRDRTRLPTRYPRSGPAAARRISICGPGPRRSDDAGEAGQDADALALAHPALKARLNQQRQRIADIVEHYRQSNAAGPQAQPDRDERRQRGKRHRHGIEREVPLGIAEGVRHSEQHTR